MIYFYLARMEGLTTRCTCGAVEKHHFFSEVHPSLPVFVAGPEAVVGQKAFALYTRLFFLDFFWVGVGVMPGFCHKSFGFILRGHDQGDRVGSEGVAFSEPLHDSWHADFVFSS